MFVEVVPPSSPLDLVERQAKLDVDFGVLELLVLGCANFIEHSLKLHIDTDIVKSFPRI